MSSAAPEGATARRAAARKSRAKARATTSKATPPPEVTPSPVAPPIVPAPKKRDDSDRKDRKDWSDMSGEEIAAELNELLAETGLTGTPLLTRDPKQKNRTPLAVACVNRKLDDVVKELNTPTGFVPIDLVDDDGRSPVFLACSVGAADVVSELLARDADLAQPDKGGRTPVGVVCAQKNYDVMRTIIGFDHGSDVARKHLVDACAQGKLDKVSFLLDCGLEVDGESDDDQFPLDAACLVQQTDVIELLLDRGSQRGPHCLSFALDKCLIEATRALVDGGVEVKDSTLYPAGGALLAAVPWDSVTSSFFSATTAGDNNK
eukprot:CAMPEP_0198645626 /NCGR_PEP_ID=MMETSP1467-20131203/1343_1 /TAXON_ID=1462469 /ORGANISM="unid. sp., Strain CCMP2135" /LENGTH=318 /DNA_ID=CAMNT_0044381119 /DNA_START=27 /DNA_END=984 /DNA_ORIENTATION=-